MFPKIFELLGKCFISKVLIYFYEDEIPARSILLLWGVGN